jgi:hypothetical protein
LADKDGYFICFVSDSTMKPKCGKKEGGGGRGEEGGRGERGGGRRRKSKPRGWRAARYVLATPCTGRPMEDVWLMAVWDTCNEISNENRRSHGALKMKMRTEDQR